MKPVRAILLAGLTAAVLAAPISSAEAHKRHRGHNAAPAFALGIFAGALLGQGLHQHRVYRPHYQYGPPYGNAGTCQGLGGGEYEACMSSGIYAVPTYRAPAYTVVPRHRYRSYYHRHNDPYYPGPGVNIIIGR